MAMQNDVNAISLTASGDVFNGRTRVRGIVVVPGTSAGSVVLKDGGSSGTTILTIPTIANGEPFNMLIPDQGILFKTSAYATLSGTATGVTVFYA
jgi:hypothetical protein